MRKRWTSCAPATAETEGRYFAVDDPIEQAIGPDPFKPQAFRVWMWEDVPGVYPSAVSVSTLYGKLDELRAERDRLKAQLEAAQRHEDGSDDGEAVEADLAIESLRDL